MASDDVTCLWQVKGEDCGERAIDTVLIRDRTGSAKIPVCALHRAEHNRKAAELRVKHG